MMNEQRTRSAMWPGLLEQYREWLPVSEATPRLSLGEGNTPLVYSDSLSRETGLNVYLKWEGLNPTGSFKDRGMVLAVAKAAESGATAVICASTGNTSASAAAYATRAGLRAVILIPDGYVALGKLAQAMMYGAQIVAVRGNFDQALDIVRTVADPLHMTVVNSVNPYRIAGQQTAAFEICDALADAPDYLCIPVGNAGNISAYWAGFQAYHKAHLTTKLPKMHGFEAEGSAAIVRGQRIEYPETFATAIRIGNPASWSLAVAAAQTSNGAIGAVTDDEIRTAYQRVAREGVFVEPASAASVAGLCKMAKNGQLEREATVVCVVTGNGLKDPDAAVATSARPAIVVDCEVDEVVAALQVRP